MSPAAPLSDDDAPLSLPDRFEALNREAGGKLESIVVRIEPALQHLDQLYSDMKGAARGAFLVLRGDSGAGKTTFLHTVHMAREGVETISVGPEDNVREFFRRSSNAAMRLQIFVLEEREVAMEYTDAELEVVLHGINGFIRSASGQNAIVVWPCNTDALRDRIVRVASALGDDSLLGIGEPFYYFSGPEKHQYRSIAETTISVLNEGATFSDLGVSSERVDEFVETSSTIGKARGKVRREVATNEQHVSQLLKREQYQLWILVISGDEPDKEVAALTRGQRAAVDIERLMSATDANVVKELKKEPQKLGILGTVLNAKIFHLPVLTALAIARSFGDSPLVAKMRAAELSVTASKQTDAVERLIDSDLARLLKSESQGRQSPGPKIGSNTQAAYAKLAEIARTNDGLLNKSIGAALLKAGLIKSYKTEQSFGSESTRTSDLWCETDVGLVRIECMWRSRTSRAEIANYTLSKLQSYGKAIGFLT